jgi:hypothetical protein
MYLLAHRWTGDRLAAGVAGIIFSFNGLTQSFLMWPSHMATFSWLPWMLFLGPEGWRKGGKWLTGAIAAGVFQMLAGGPETILLTWLLLLGLWIVDLVQAGQKNSRTLDRSARLLHEPASRRAMLLRFPFLALLIALICAAQLLPFLELLLRSQRDTGYAAVSKNWSMPLWGWANFLVPLFRTTPTPQGVFLQNDQYWASSYYAGVGTLLLGLIAVWRVRDWRVGLAAGSMLLGGVLAWGDKGHLFTALKACLPGVGFARYPVKFVILTLAFAPLLAAFGVKALTSRERAFGRFELGCVLALLFLIGLTVGVDWNSDAGTDVRDAILRNGIVRGFFLVLTAVLIWRFPLATQTEDNQKGQPGWRQGLFGGLLLAVFWLDLGSHMPNQNPVVRPAAYAPAFARSQLNWKPAPEPGISRALVSRSVRETLSVNWLPDLEQNYMRNRLAARANCNLLDNVPQIDGFYSLVPREANSVLVLPYKKDAGDLTPLLDFVGVSQITKPGDVLDWEARPTAMPLVTCGQRAAFTPDDVALAAFSKTNTDFREMVFFPPEARDVISATQHVAAHVLSSEFSQQKISFETESPAETVAVISQTFYPAWRAYVDDARTGIWRANVGFQAIQLPAGHHRVQLKYEDHTFRVGLALSGLGLAMWLAFWISQLLIARRL